VPPSFIIHGRFEWAGAATNLPVQENEFDPSPWKFLNATLGNDANGRRIIPVVLEVTARETVEVPAGKFECFKLPLNIGQTFWISDDAHRYLVKFEGGGATGSLASVSQHRPGAAIPFRDDALGVSLITPADWVVFRLQSRTGKKEMLGLLDPAADLSMGSLALVRTDSLSPAERPSSRQWAETDFRENLAKELKEAKIRPESWRNVNLGGRLGVSYITDFVESDKPRVGFAVRVLGPKTSEAFNMTCPPEKFDALKEAFDRIIASYRLTK